MGGEWTQACNNCCTNEDKYGDFNDFEGQDGKDPNLNIQKKDPKNI